MYSWKKSVIGIIFGLIYNFDLFILFFSGSGKDWSVFNIQSQPSNDKEFW